MSQRPLRTGASSRINPALVPALLHDRPLHFHPTTASSVGVSGRWPRIVVALNQCRILFVRLSQPAH
jgi:hypothetical protein